MWEHNADDENAGLDILLSFCLYVAVLLRYIWYFINKKNLFRINSQEANKSIYQHKEEKYMLIITVTEKNRFLFEKMAPEEFFDPLDKEGHFVIGAIGEDEEGWYAAGVLIFDVAIGGIDEDIVMAGFLKWLYIGSEFRNRGAADALMQEMFRLLAGSGIEAVLCDLPIDMEYVEFSGYLRRWGFEFDLVDVDEVRVSLDILMKKPDLCGNPSENVISLNNAPVEMIENGTNLAVRQKNIAPDLEERVRLCDKDISCITVEDNKVVGMTVVNRLAESVLEITFLRTFPYNPKNMVDMIYFISGKIKNKYKPDTEIRFTSRNDLTVKIIQHLLPDAEPLLVYRGVSLTMVEEE